MAALVIGMRTTALGSNDYEVPGYRRVPLGKYRRHHSAAPALRSEDTPNSTLTISRGGDTDTNAAICGALLGSVVACDEPVFAVDLGVSHFDRPLRRNSNCLSRCVLIAKAIPKNRKRPDA